MDGSNSQEFRSGNGKLMADTLRNGIARGVVIGAAVGIVCGLLGLNGIALGVAAAIAITLARVILRPKQT